MNDKIKKLAERAFEESSKELAVTDPARWYSDKGPDIDIVFEKFAELIVQECIAMCDVKSEDPLLYKQGVIFAVNRCQQNIKQHFGVEE
jgi:hypothetical protein